MNTEKVRSAFLHCANDTSFIFAFVYNCDIIHFQLNELSIETMKGFEESCSN